MQKQGQKLNRFILKLMDLLSAIPVPAWIRKRNYRTNLAILEAVNNSSADIPGQSASSAHNHTVGTSIPGSSPTGRQPAMHSTRPQFMGQRSQCSPVPALPGEPFSDQHAPLWKGARFGRFSMEYNGCGEIAVINLLRLLGRCSTPEQEADVIAALERQGAVLLGLFGTSPLALIRFLKKQKVFGKVCIAPDSQTLESLWQEYDLFLITAWNNPKKRLRGIHTFTAEKRTAPEDRRKTYTPAASFSGKIQTSTPVVFSSDKIQLFVSYNAAYRQWPDDVIIATGFRKEKLKEEE